MGLFKDYRQRKSRIFIAISPVLVLFLSMGYALPFLFQSGYSMEKALKVLSVIDDILEEQTQAGDRGLKSVEVTESEFNAYLAFLIDADNEEVLREVYVNFLTNNRIEAKIHIDLRQKEIPRFLKPELNFYFAGRINVINGRARLAIKEVFLENEPVQPALLDLAILIASRIQNVEPIGLYDWYELPYGIKNIQTKKGIAIFYY